MDPLKSARKTQRLSRQMKVRDLFNSQFNQGRYRELVQGKTSKITDVVSKIGAHSFLGEVLAAEELLSEFRQKLESESLAAALFFLTIAKIRKARFKEAQNLIREIHSLSKREEPEGSAQWSRFFAAQSLAFYYYYIGQFSKAEVWALRSHQIANKLDQLYPQILAGDLLGHCSIEHGRINFGLELLKGAAKKADQLGHRSLKSAIEISLLCYRSEFGLQAETLLKDLLLRRSQLETEDSYSWANLSLEIAKQKNLAGQFDEARRELESLMPLIFSFENRRQEMNWSLLLSENQLLRGQAVEAQITLRSSNHLLKTLLDPHFQKRIQTMQERILLFANSKSLTPGFKINEAEVSENQLLRDFQTVQSSPHPFAEIHKLGYWSWIFYIFNATPGRNQIFIFEHATSFLTLDSDGFRFHSRGLTPIYRKLLFGFKEGSASKPQLFEKAWELKYSRRHDNVLHSTIASLRKILPVGWIETTDEGYHFKSQVFVLKAGTRNDDSWPQLEISLPANSGPWIDEQNLNLRQLQVIEIIKTAKYFSISQYRKRFQISNMTAFRDLKHLVDKGLLKKIGSGRGTKYLGPTSL